MSYRKIVVNGIQYEYVVGKTHTKIRGVGVYPNASVGYEVDIDPVCKCCGELTSVLYPSRVLEKIILVEPRHVKYIIERDVK